MENAQIFNIGNNWHYEFFEENKTDCIRQTNDLSIMNDPN